MVRTVDDFGSRQPALVQSKSKKQELNENPLHQEVDEISHFLM
jgi:hypothetical protein